MTLSTVVDKATFSNTASGTVVTHPKTGKTIDFEVNRDKDNSVIYTTNLKAVTQQVDRTFPAVLTADKVASIAQASKKLKQPLQVEDNCDYRLSGEPVEFEANAELDLPASMQATYKPIVSRDAISF